jgi:[ribosomal protein S5]-alanine N-acetyltransferase
MIETTRLKLVPLKYEDVLLYKLQPRLLAKSLGVNYLERQNDPRVLGDIEEAIDFWTEQTKKHPDEFEWFTSWEIILKNENVAIGGIGFAGAPDEKGKSTIGYGLDLRYHGKGYASEALKALIEWGFHNPSLTLITAETPEKNFPSHKVLVKNGFTLEKQDYGFLYWQLPKEVFKKRQFHLRTNNEGVAGTPSLQTNQWD